MKVFWVVNVLFPFPSKELGLNESPFGGWLMGLYNELIKCEDIELAVATVYSGNDYKSYYDGKTKYYLIPQKNQKKFWYNSVIEFNPDLIHIHGTEYEYGRIIQSLFPHKRTIVSIQGLVSKISDFYISYINRGDIIKNTTIRDIIRGNIYREQKIYYKRGKIEQDILKKCTAIVGRTNWDYACSYEMVGKDKYYKCNESLRDLFYNVHWNIKNVEKNSIYFSQANYPIKGFHILIEAANILKYNYNCKDLKIYVAGYNITDLSNMNKRIRASGYAKYLLSKIRKYKLEDNIIFTGLLKEKEVLKYMLKTNVFVQASSIENSPNSLGEAMLIGMPCVASYVGGTMDMLRDKEEGYLYPFGDASLLAYYIYKVFNDNKKSVEMGKLASMHANETHNRIKNANEMIDIYREVLNR